MTNFELIKNMDIYQLTQFLNYLIDGSSADFDWDLEMNGYTYEDTMPDPPGDEIRIWLGLEAENCPVVGLRSRILAKSSNEE